MALNFVPAKHRRFLAETRSAYLFLLPSLIIFGVFMIYPMLYGFWISFHRWSLLGEPFFNNGANYPKLLTDKNFWNSLRITTVYTAMFVPSITVVALIVAGALNGPIRFKGLLRSLYFVPIMSSAIIVGLCFEWIYNGEVGVLAFLMDWLGFPKVGLLGSKQTVLPALAAMTVWWVLGYYVTIYLAGLQSIPAHLYEAARIDGANGWHLVRYVTVPLMRPIILLVIVLATIASFKIFDAIYVMTYGGPAGATIVMTWLIFQEAFLNYKFGYAAAITYALFVIVLAITLIELRVLRARYEY